MSFLNWYSDHPWLGTLIVLVAGDVAIGLGKLSVCAIGAVRGDDVRIVTK